jgi:MFS superfamily sulfate permease-like transporter
LGRLGDTHDFVNIAVHPEAKPVAGMIILRPDEPLFFANAERILNQARQNISAAGSSVQTIILSLEESPDLDGSSLEALQDFMQFVVAHDKKLLLTRLKHPVHEILKRMTERDPNAPLLSGLSVDQAVRIASAKPLRSEGTVSP